MFVIGRCGLYFGPIVGCMHNMLRQIPYHVHVGLQVEVHVNGVNLRISLDMGGNLRFKNRLG